MSIRSRNRTDRLRPTSIVAALAVAAGLSQALAGNIRDTVGAPTEKTAASPQDQGSAQGRAVVFEVTRLDLSALAPDQFGDQD